MVNLNTSKIEIFNPADVRRFKHKAKKIFKDHDFLFEWATRNTLDRLKDIRRDFKKILHIGHRYAHLYKTSYPEIEIYAEDDLYDIGVFSLEENSYDLILSTLDMHTINDLPGALSQLRASLKPDGLFLATIFGGETLFELRDSLAQAELKTKDGISPRIFPFADKQQIGGLLQRAGFALPVVDSEILTVTYPNIFKLMHEIRGMGESNSIINRNKKNPGRALFFEAAQHYQTHHSDPDGRIRASFEIIFFLGWSPHASQQQPLRPGSAKHSLAEALITQEIKIKDA